MISKSFLWIKVHIFWEGHKILRNLHQLFDWQYIGQIIGGDFAKFCGLLRIYELYLSCSREFGVTTPLLAKAGLGTSNPCCQQDLTRSWQILLRFPGLCQDRWLPNWHNLLQPTGSSFDRLVHPSQHFQFCRIPSCLKLKSNSILIRESIINFNIQYKRFNYSLLKVI